VLEHVGVAKRVHEEVDGVVVDERARPKPEALT